METRMRNGAACPLKHQTGAQAIRDFDAILASWSLTDCADFERERAARTIELDQIIAGQTEKQQQSAWHASSVAAEASKEHTMNDQDLAATLASIPLFRELVPAQIAHISARLHRMIARAGATIISAHQPGDAVYIVLDGALKVSVEETNGSSAILSILGAREVVGEMSMVEGPDCSATITVLERSTLLWMQRADFQECLRTMPVLALNLSMILARRLQQASAQILSLATQDVYGRVARTLLDCAQAHGRPAANRAVTIPLRLTQNDLANMVGASRERVNLVLAFYRGKGYLSAGPRYAITIYDTAALARYC
ncbi:MAG: Crp/Fnr family transcriptional regulator [Roseiflexaceae bacterium]